MKSGKPFPRLFLAALAVCCCPRPSDAWQARQEITRAAVEAMSPDEAIIQKLGVETSKLRESLSIPDRRDTLIRDKVVWFYANDFLLFQGNTLRRAATSDGLEEDAVAFFSRALQALRTESVPNSGRWIGALLHYAADCGSPATAAEIKGELRARFDELADPKAIHIRGYQPILLGRTEAEAISGLRKRLDGLIKFANRHAELAKPLIADTDRSKADAVIMDCAQETSRVVADVLYTLGELAALPSPGKSGALRGAISGRPGQGVERVPARVLIEGTPFSTLADEDGRYVFRDVPVGNYMIDVVRPGSVVSREPVKVPPAETAVKDIALKADAPIGNMLRDATLSQHWLKTAWPDSWSPATYPAIMAPGNPGEESWAGEPVPLKPGSKYRLQVEWQPTAKGKVTLALFGAGGPNKPHDQLKTLAPGETAIEFSATQDTPYAALFISGQASAPEKICLHVAISVTGFEMGEWPVCNRIRFFPAPGGEQAMAGGRFEGSNAGPFEGFEPLAEIKIAPPADHWTELKFPNHKIYRWLRYLGPEGSYGKIAEVEFYSGQRQLGPGGAYGSIVPERSWQQASDGNTKTWFESNLPDDQFVGLDLRDVASSYYPRFTPDPGTFDGPVDVQIKSGPPGTVIRYTLDGSLPTPTNGDVYVDQLHLDKTTTVQAVAFQDGRAPSPPISATYLLKDSKPGLITFHSGNSLTATTSFFKYFARTAGFAQDSVIYGRPGAWTKELWDASLTQDKERFDSLWASLPRIDHFTVQPRDFDIAEEADYDIRWFNRVREKSPGVQPWLYCEWTEMKRERPTDKGEVSSSQMRKLYPALTWEESMGAMMLYMEELQKKIAETYHEGKRPRILPTALAMGWIKNMIDAGKLPGIAPGSFYPLLFNDQVHPTANPFVNENGNGGYLVDLTWFSAFYRENPEGRVLPVGTTFTPEQTAVLQRLAWDVIKNYPDCGFYEEGQEPVGKPEFSVIPRSIAGVTPVTLSSSTPGAWFRYTLDGTTPTRTKGYIYCGLISVRPGMSVKAIAYKSGFADSPVAEGAYSEVVE